MRNKSKLKLICDIQHNALQKSFSFGISLVNVNTPAGNCESVHIY